MYQSLKYTDYTKRRLSVLLAPKTIFSFFNPVVHNGCKIYQVHIDINKVVKVFDGTTWGETEDEDLLYKIITALLKKETQKEIEFKEAV